MNYEKIYKKDLRYPIVKEQLKLHYDYYDID